MLFSTFRDKQPENQCDLDENGNVKHGQETVSSAIPEKHEQGSITVVPETQESVSSTLRSVVPDTGV